MNTLWLVASARPGPMFRDDMPPSTSQHFLGVEKSVTGRRWVSALDVRSEANALAMSQKLGLPDVVARVLAARGVEASLAERFLDPKLRHEMPDPSVMTDMDAAAERLAEAILRREQVAIFGDYDVDGAASAALISRFLSHYGLDPVVRIPDRITEGYGPNPQAVDELADAGATLLVSVDCGTSSFETFDHARSRGLDVVVLDHHQTGSAIPEVVALVNPNRQDDLSGLGYLAAAGVVFMTLVAVQRQLRGRSSQPPLDLMRLLDIVALATVCDVVPLKGLNRAIVVQGLAVMRRQDNVGLKALCRVARLSGPVRSGHLGFLLGPRINAGGRIGDAALGSRLLCLDDEAAAEAIAEQLDTLNQERQAMEARMLAEADAVAAKDHPDHADATGTQSDMTVVNAPFQNSGIFCSGQYSNLQARTPYLTSFDPGLFSVQCLFKPASFGGAGTTGRPIIMADISRRWLGAEIGVEGQLIIRTNNSTLADTGVTLSLDTWYNLVLCYDGATDELRVYLDESLVHTVTEYTPNAGSGTQFLVRNGANGTAFHGVIKEIKVYDTTDVPLATEPVSWSRVKSLF